MRTSRPSPAASSPAPFQEEMQPLNQNYLQDNGPLFALRQMLSVGTWGFMRPPCSAFPGADGIPLMGVVTLRTGTRGAFAGRAGWAGRTGPWAMGQVGPATAAPASSRAGPHAAPPSAKFFFNNKHLLCAGPPASLSTRRARVSAGAVQHLMRRALASRPHIVT